MKKQLIIGIIQMIACLMLSAQNKDAKQSNPSTHDKIIKENGDEINNVKVTEITLTEIKYIKASNPNGPNYIIKKTDVFMIKYSNGEKYVVEMEEDSKTPQTEMVSQVSQTQPAVAPVNKEVATGAISTNELSIKQQSKTEIEQSYQTGFKKNQFGASFLIGQDISYFYPFNEIVELRFGFSWRYNLSKHFAFDYLTANVVLLGDIWKPYIQIMPGLIFKTTGKTVFFFENRIGYGHGFFTLPDDNDYQGGVSGLCYEGDLGLLLTQNFAVSFSANYQNLAVEKNYKSIDGVNYQYSMNRNLISLGLKFGFYF